MKRVFQVDYAGTIVRYTFLNRLTALYFARHIHLSQNEEPDISLDDHYFKIFRDLYPSEYTDDYVEFKGLLYRTAAYLLPLGGTMFHAVSFLYKGKAWLLAARSGTGKTTQYNNWNTAFPEEITMICGDMPLLDFRDKKILVHPSPWNGKERIGNDVYGELGGIFFLKQDKDNRIESCGHQDAIHALFSQFTIMPEGEEEILLLSSCVERIVNEIPLYRFSNDGSMDSTALLRSFLDSKINREEKI